MAQGKPTAPHLENSARKLGDIDRITDYSASVAVDLESASSCAATAAEAVDAAAANYASTSAAVVVAVNAVVAAAARAAKAKADFESSDSDARQATIIVAVNAGRAARDATNAARDAAKAARDARSVLAKSVNLAAAFVVRNSIIAKAVADTYARTFDAARVARAATDAREAALATARDAGPNDVSFIAGGIAAMAAIAAETASAASLVANVGGATTPADNVGEAATQAAADPMLAVSSASVSMTALASAVAANAVVDSFVAADKAAWVYDFFEKPNSIVTANTARDAASAAFAADTVKRHSAQLFAAARLALLCTVNYYLLNSSVNSFASRSGQGAVARPAAEPASAGAAAVNLEPASRLVAPRLEPIAEEVQAEKV